jgi:ABC-type multidrug transport system fused ATPase/permease subunit
MKKFSFIGNLCWYFSLIKKVKPQLFLVLIFGVFAQVLESLGLVFLPALIVSGLTAHTGLRDLLIKVVSLTIAIAFAHFIKEYTMNRRFGDRVAIRLHIQELLTHSFLTMPYEDLLAPVTRARYLRVKVNATQSNAGGAESYYLHSYALLSTLATLLVFVFTMATITPLILLATALSGAIAFAGLRYAMRGRLALKEPQSTVQQRLEYLDDAAYKVENAKDMRLF